MKGGLRQVRDRYEREHSAAGSIAMQMQFVIDNILHLRKVDRRGTKEVLAIALYHKMLRKIALQEWEISAVDDLYELTWRGYGEPHVMKHQDRRRKGLRFGR